MECYFCGELGPAYELPTYGLEWVCVICLAEDNELIEKGQN